MSNRLPGAGSDVSPEKGGTVPDDDLDRLRTLLANAHDSAAPGPRNIFQAVKGLFSVRVKKKANDEWAEVEKKKDAA
jgi:hypothetical protein